MSTAGRINKSGPRFVPKRKTPAAAPTPGSSRASREGSVASSTSGPTPKAGPVALPPVGEDLAEDEDGELRGSTANLNNTAAGSQQQSTSTGTAGTSFKPGASFFGPSDPTASSSLFSTQASTVASTSGSTFGFQPRDPTQSTQATSFGAPNQPPASKSPNVAAKNASTLFLPDPAALSPPRPSPAQSSPSAPSASALSSSPSRGTAFSVSAIPPTLLSPTRRAAELQPQQQDVAANRGLTPPLPVPPAATASKKRKAVTPAPAEDEEENAGEDETGADEAPTSPNRASKGKQKAGTRPPPAKRTAAAAKQAKGLASAQADEDDEEAAPSTSAATGKKNAKSAAPTTKARPKPRRTASRRASVEAEMQGDMAGQAGADIPVGEPDAAEEGNSGESTDEYDRAHPKKRVRKRKQPKKGAVDRFLFGADSDDENARRAGDLRVGGGRPAREEEGEGGAGAKEVEADEQDELEQEEDDEFDEEEEEEAPVNKRKKRKAPAATKKAAAPRKRKAKGKKVAAADEQEGGEDADGDGAGPDADAEGSQAARTPSPEPLPPVEPDETLMATLADPVPKVQIGRPSERTIFFEERELRLKAERKQLLKLRREKMKRRKKGLPVSDDDEPELGADGAGAHGEATPAPDDEHLDGGAGAGAGVAQADEEGRDLFRLPSLGADEDDDANGQNEGVDMFNGIDAINRFAAAQAEGREVGDEEEDDEDEAGFEETNWAPQMRIVDGQLVLDESSLQVERGNQTQQILNREVVEESAQDRFINSSSYGKRKGGARWSKEETELFYDGLSQFYTNFEMIAIMFPHRSRHEIRRKFNREDKLNPKLVTAALARRKRVDIDAIAKLTGADLSGPIPEDPMDAVNRRRAEIEANGGEIPEPAGGRKRKGKGKKEEGGDRDDDAAAVLGGSRKRKGKKGAANAAMGYMPGEEDEDGAGGDEEEEDEDVRQVRLEMEEEERQRRIDEMEAAGAA